LLLPQECRFRTPFNVVSTTDEAAYCSREDEKITGTTRSSVGGHCHLEQSYGSDTETPAGARQSLHIFEEVEGQGSQLEQLVATVQQCLEGSVTQQVIQEFTKQEALVKQQVEAARAKIKAFEAVLPRSE
jgi:paraquat-inducible protein B